MKRVAIVQSNYLPWKGYFDLIHSVDEFVLYDDVKYTKGDWRNRNRVKTAHGPKWLTIPTRTKGEHGQLIREVKICDDRWAQRHWKTIVQSYSKAPWFEKYRGILEDLYIGCEEEYLSRINRRFLGALTELLGITTPLTCSSDYGPATGSPTGRLVALCRAAGADRYLSDPSARNYIEEDLFEEAGIRLEYFDYRGYPEYEQLHPPFRHDVSVVDLLLMCGPEAGRFIWGWRGGGPMIRRDPEQSGQISRSPS